MLLGIPRSARCVQRFDDSLNSAIHITYRISLRSSSMREPRDPLLKVVSVSRDSIGRSYHSRFSKVCEAVSGGGEPPSSRKRARGVCEGWDGDAARFTPLSGRSRARRRPPRDALMILPQVHLRKPCYDFYFL